MIKYSWKTTIKAVLLIPKFRKDSAAALYPYLLKELIHCLRINIYILKHVRRKQIKKAPSLTIKFKKKCEAKRNQGKHGNIHLHSVLDYNRKEIIIIIITVLHAVCLFNCFIPFFLSHRYAPAQSQQKKSAIITEPTQPKYASGLSI